MSPLSLQTRQGTFQLQPECDIPIVQLAKQNKIPWGYVCERGICAQCRTLVLEGAEYLNEPTEEEKRRLRKAERAEGFRLGCQIRIVTPGAISLAHKPY